MVMGGPQAPGSGAHTPGSTPATSKQARPHSWVSSFFGGNRLAARQQPGNTNVQTGSPAAGNAWQQQHSPAHRNEFVLETADSSEVANSPARQEWNFDGSAGNARRKVYSGMHLVDDESLGASPVSRRPRDAFANMQLHSDQETSRRPVAAYAGMQLMQNPEEERSSWGLSSVSKRRSAFSGAVLNASHSDRVADSPVTRGQRSAFANMQLESGAVPDGPAFAGAGSAGNQRRGAFSGARMESMADRDPMPQHMVMRSDEDAFSDDSV